MKQKIIQLAMKLGGLQLAKFFTRKKPRIFMYHSFSKGTESGYVSAERFEWQLKHIKSSFNVLSLIQLSELINTNQKVPNNTVVITIDDGYKNFYDVAYPLLRKYNLPATLFVTTGYVNKDLWLWPDQLSWILDQSEVFAQTITIDKHTFKLLGDKSADWLLLNNICLSMQDKSKLEFIAKLSDLLGVEVNSIAPEKYASCSWPELIEMQSNGIEIGGHTVTHPSLGKVEFHQAKNEINQCLLDINNHLGERKRTFCYPNGQPSDYNNDIKKIVKTAGFASAVTAFSDINDLNIDFSWRRFCGDKSSFEFKKSLYGIEYIGNKLKKFERCNY